MIRNYFKTAWRSLWKSRVASFISIIGLAAGMTAAILILLWVQNELNFDQDHPGADKIYRLTSNVKKENWIWETTPLLLADAAKKEIPEIEQTARLNTDNQPVFNINGKLSYEKNCAYVDDSWFSLFHYDFIKGSVASFAGNSNRIILTASEAKKYFGNKNALGLAIRIDSTSYEVKAVVSDAPANSSFQYRAFLPLAALLRDKARRENDEQWQNANYITFVKLRPGSNAEVTTHKLTTLLQDKSDDKERSSSISLVALKDMHFENGLQSSVFLHGNHHTVYIFTVLAFLLLLVACINYVNLTTAKASLRAKEVSIRKIVGAKRIHLFYQFVAESLLVSFASFLATLVLIQLCLPFFNELTGKNFVISISLSSQSLWQVTGLTLLVALVLNSIYPALLLSSFKPLNAFRGSAFLKVKDSYFRKGLVIVQFTISIMLIAGTIIIYRQMQFVQHSDPGYNRAQVLSFPIPVNVDRQKKELLMQEIKQELLAQSNIESVTMANQSIVNMGSMSTGNADWDGHDKTYNPKISQLAADADFQVAMQLQMKSGRWFGKGNEADKNNVVLNETSVAELNIHKPVIGQRFTFKGKTGQIIGVVKNFHYQSLHDKTGPLVVFNDPGWYNFFMVRVAPGNTSGILQGIQNTWKKFFPDQPLNYSFLDESFGELYKQDQQASFLITVFAAIAVVISSMGLFSLVTFTAEQKTKEISIRKVLGASIGHIVTLVSREFLGLIIIAIILASPLAYLATQKWLQGFAYRIHLDWWIFALAGVLAMVIALFTISFQSIKAAVANPIKSLRNE
ncbi:MAG: ABC transporter permease [Janthinobacterium lividum]